MGESQEAQTDGKIDLDMELALILDAYDPQAAKTVPA